MTVSNTAEQLISLYLSESVPKEPYLRAKKRIEDLQKRFDDDDKVTQHTLLRLKKLSNENKIEGLYLAAKDMGLKKIAQEARKKFKEMTGGWPREL